MKVSTAWAMPNKWTFQIKPITEFVERWTDGACKVLDPFCGTSLFADYCNDLSQGGIDAEEYCKSLLKDHAGSFDVVIFDPPYSPRQISECYKGIGRRVTGKDTQNASLYKRVRQPMRELLKPGGIALSFGWQSSGFGKAWPTEEVMLVQHGGAHNDTICVAQRKPSDLYSNQPDNGVSQCTM